VWETPSQWRHWLGVTSASVAATLLNPYGVGLWTFIATTVRMTRPIDEWQSLWRTPVLNWIPWGLAVSGLIWMWRRRAAHRLSIGLTLGMLAYASARVLRIESLFITAAVLLLAPVLAARWPRRPPVLPASALRGLAIALFIATLPLAVLLGRRAVSCVPIMGTWTPDLVAMAALKHAGPGRIVTPFNWGQYAIWHLSPRLRVSMDGRRETVYSDARLRSHEEVLTGAPGGLEELARWQVEYAWLPAVSTTTTTWLADHGYRIDVETRQSRVAVRGDLPRLPAARDPATIRPCFPG